MTDSPLDDNGQRMVSGFGTLHADTSKQEHDVEDLEQQVIDDQTKQQQNLVEQMKNKVRVVAERRILTNHIALYWSHDVFEILQREFDQSIDCIPSRD